MLCFLKKSPLVIFMGLMVLSGCSKEDQYPLYDQNDFMGYTSERYRISEDGMYGFIDREGKVVIDAQYKYDPYFINGYAVIRGPRNDSVIDETGNTVIAADSFSLRAFSPEGLCPAERWNSLMGYIDLSGELIVPLEYEDAQPFYNGLARVKLNNRYGYLEPSGELAIECQFIWAGTFNNGLAVVGDGELSGYIDRNGDLAIPMDFARASMFSENLAAVSDGEKWGFIDTSGKLVIPYSFERVMFFSYGLCPAFSDGYWGYINRSGEWAIAPRYTNAYMFVEGLAVVKIDNRSGYIDKNGDYVIEPQFKYGHSFENGLAQVLLNEGASAYIDREGQIVYNFETDYQALSKGSSSYTMEDAEEELLRRILDSRSF